MSRKMDNGWRSTGDSDFHHMMRSLYDQQHETEDLVDVNQYHVHAKIPASLYREFHAVLKKNNWSISTGVQYAIHKLSQQKNQAS